MPKITLKTVLILTAMGSVAATATAQVTKITEPVNVPTRAVDADFVVADINQDGSLDRDEFVSFAVIKSDAGNDKFRAIVTSGEFDKKFAVHDHDADGKITAAEMGHADKMADKAKDKMKDKSWSEKPDAEVEIEASDAETPEPETK